MTKMSGCIFSYYIGFIVIGYVRISFTAMVFCIITTVGIVFMRIGSVFILLI